MTEADGDRPLPRWKSLRARGVIATLVLFVYLLASGLYVAHERAQIYDSLQALDALAQHEKALALADAAVAGALVDVSEMGSAAAEEPGVPTDLKLYMETCDRLFAALNPFDPGYERLHRAIVRSYDGLVAAPVRAHWIDLREALHRAADDFEIRRRTLADRREALTRDYQQRYDAVTVESLALAVVGLVGFGSFALWFFARLARDLRRLESHARDIVRGRRGVALDVRRDDEVGRLMHAVNRMAVDLDEREKQIELDSQRRSHHDKMLAVGALAAGVAHEVNNPLMVIHGVAQELKAGAAPERVAEGAQLILSQAQRAAQVARQLADVAAPQPAAFDWLDFNALVRRVVQLAGYDRRYRALTFDVQADPALPALRSSGDALQQIVMQLLQLGCDALAAVGTPATVALATAGVDGGIELRLTLPPVVDFARPEVQRSLLLARAVAEPLGGRLAFDQHGGPGLCMKLALPVDVGREGS